MKNITKNMFLLVSALTVGVNCTRGDDYNPDYRERVWSKILEACSKQVSDFLDKKRVPVELRKAELICCGCADKMMKIVEDYKKSNEKTDYVELNHILNTGGSIQVDTLESNFKTVLDKNKHLWGKTCCYFSHSSPSSNLPLLSRSIIPALSLLDVCDRFQKQYECEMHAMHKRMMDPELYVGQVNSEVLRTLICGYERVSKKAAKWELCNNSRPSEGDENVDPVWDKYMYEFLKSRKGAKALSPEEIFDAFVGYNDNAFVQCWGRQCLFKGDWWAETKPVKIDDPRVYTDDARRLFRETTAQQYYHSAFAWCWPTQYCENDFKQVAEIMVNQCKDSLDSLCDELSEKKKVLDPTLIWFLDEVLKPHIDAKQAKMGTP